LGDKKFTIYNPQGKEKRKVIKREKEKSISPAVWEGEGKG